MSEESPVTSHQLWPDVQKALDLPDNLPVTGFQLEAKAGGLVTVTLTFLISESRGEAFTEVLKNYKLIEKKEEQ